MSLLMSKCHIVGNHMLRLNYIIILSEMILLNTDNISDNIFFLSAKMNT